MGALEEIKGRAEVNSILGKTASQDEARDTLKLVAALEAVEGLHESGHVWSLTDEGHVDEDGTLLATFCTHCTPEATIEAIGDCEWTEDYETVRWPCPTLTAITEALA